MIGGKAGIPTNALRSKTMSELSKGTLHVPSRTHKFPKFANGLIYNQYIRAVLLAMYFIV